MKQRKRLHDKDGDIDSDDYMAARDKAIKKAMGKDKKDESVKEELTDKHEKNYPRISKKQLLKNKVINPKTKLKKK